MNTNNKSKIYVIHYRKLGSSYVQLSTNTALSCSCNVAFKIIIIINDDFYSAVTWRKAITRALVLALQTSVVTNKFCL